MERCWEPCAGRDGLSQKELARRAGVSRSAIGMYEAGEREPGFETLQTFAGIFGVTADVLLGRPEAGQALPDNALPLLPVKKVPLLGTIACGTPVLAQENIAGYVDLPDHVGADFALVCRGTSMINAGIRDGDIVYIRQSDRCGQRPDCRRAGGGQRNRGHAQARLCGRRENHADG